MAQCKAKAHSTGQQCRRRAVTGYTVCQVHGAGSPLQGRPGGRPIVHGKYSKRLPSRMLEAYEQAATDQKLLDLDGEVALVDARVADILSRVDTGEAGDTWKNLQAAVDHLEIALVEKDADAILETYRTLRAVTKRGAADWAAWDEIKSLVYLRKTLVESQRKRLVELGQFITMESAVTLMRAVQELIMEEIREPDARRRAAEKLVRLVSFGSESGASIISSE